MTNNTVPLWRELIHHKGFCTRKRKGVDTWIDRNRLRQSDGMKDKQISREVNGRVFMVLKWMNGNIERWKCEQTDINIWMDRKIDQFVVVCKCWSMNHLLPSSSIGCFRAVMSLNVHRNSTTCSFSFLIGAMCNRSHSGVPVKFNTKQNYYYQVSPHICTIITKDRSTRVICITIRGIVCTSLTTLIFKL